MYKLMTILIATAVLAGISEGRYTPYNNRYNQPYTRPVPAPVAPAPAPLVRGGYYPGPGAQAYTLRQDQEIDDNTGSYHYGYETSNGIRAEEQATLQAYGPEEGTKSAQGSFSYTSPEGIPIQVSYVADENGFRAVGAHIPTPPPIPEAIQRSLAYNAAHPYQETEYKEPYRRYPATPARYY